MGFIFHHGVAMPVWAIVLGAFALSWLPAQHPAAAATIVIAAAASVMILMVRRFANGRPTVVPLPVTGPNTGPRGVSEPTDVLDLVRMDDDGGWRVPSRS